MNADPATPARILVVDDVVNNLRVLSTALTKQGYQIRCAKNGAIALMGVQAFAPDLILLDIKMPDMDGYELCQQLKANEKTRTIPVIFLSALDDVFDKVKAFAVGGVDYITKPFQVEEVLVRVHHQLALQAAQGEIAQLNADLEDRVRQRTTQLATLNGQLEQEILDRKQAQQLLQESEQRLESILNSLEEVVWSFSIDGTRALYVNAAVEKVYGRPRADFYQNSRLWLEMIHAEEAEKIERICQEWQQAGSFTVEYQMLRPDGDVRWLRDRGHVVHDAQGVAKRLDRVVYDITEQKRAEETLIYNALHDDLTGLPNRTLFMDRVEQTLKQSRRNPQYLFAVLFIDLDRFKVINDSLGHAVGDQLLISFAQLLEQNLRSVDSIARLGGDEFTILLDNISGIHEAIVIAERIQSAVRAPLQLKNHAVVVSASIGIVLSSDKYNHASELLRDADIAMYHAKDLGKARYAIFDQAMYAQALETLKLENDLRQALDQHELQLYYQPIVNLHTHQLTGFEALLRWQHPERGLISPSQFIPNAEENGLIVPIGEWVIRQACQQLQRWTIQFPLAHALKLSINLAWKQFVEPKLVQCLDQILLDTGLNGNALILEVTESMLMTPGQDTLNTLQQLKARDIQLSIDDFGTGYSSLSYLHRFPMDTLKIDRTFVSRMETLENFEIVKTIITLAHTLGMSVVAEGVETPKQFEQLRSLGCELAQGYYLSLPLESQAVTALLASATQSVITLP
jgi:diguanylate cyclase (GGDEF)-like protein/PAS domain S-box-containing protein